MIALPAWLTKKAIAGAVGEVPPWAWKLLAAAAIASVLFVGGCRHGQSIEAEKHAKAQQRADARQARQEAKRDAKATEIATDSHAEAAEAVGKSKAKTDEREARIAAVPVTGECVFPDGLPDLAPAVEAANAARRPPVP